MRLLYVTYGSPWPADSGARQRDAALIQAAKSVAEVTVLVLFESKDDRMNCIQTAPAGVSVDGVIQKTGALSVIRNTFTTLRQGRPLATATYYCPDFAGLIRSTLRSTHFDAVQIEHSVMAPYIEAIPIDFSGQTLLDLHNVAAHQYQTMAESQRGIGRLVAQSKAWLMRDWETRWLRRFDRVFVVSELERQLLADKDANNKLITVVSNGVNLPSKQSETTRPVVDSCRLLFVGTLGYLPNRDAVAFMRDHILPLIELAHPRARLRVVGSGGNPDQSSNGVDYAGKLDDLDGEYQQAGVVVVPLRAGGGTRLKLLEAAAHERPVVSTSIGAEGLALCSERHLLLADNPREFADQVIRILDNPDIGKTLATNAKLKIASEYTWQKVTASYIRTLRKVPDA